LSKQLVGELVVPTREQSHIVYICVRPTSGGAIEWCAENRLDKTTSRELLHLLADIDGVVFPDLYIQCVAAKEGPIGQLNPKIFDLVHVALGHPHRVYSDFVTLVRSFDRRQKVWWPGHTGELEERISLTKQFITSRWIYTHCGRSISQAVESLASALPHYSQFWIRHHDPFHLSIVRDYVKVVMPIELITLEN